MTLRVFENEILVLQKNQGRVMELFIVKSAGHQQQFLATKTNQHTVETSTVQAQAIVHEIPERQGIGCFHEYIVETIKIVPRELADE